VPSNKSQEAITAENESTAWDLRQQGWTVQRIARRLGVHHGTVVRMLARVEARVLRGLERRVENQKVQSTHVLDHIRDEALQAWERSKAAATRAVKKRKGRGEAADAEEINVTEATSSYGDPAFLDRAIAADDRIRRIWGIDSPPAKPKEDEGGGLNVASRAAAITARAKAHGEAKRDGKE
jgi:hypothetical protein